MSIQYHVEEAVAVITLGGTGKTSWGTAIEEHRINPQTVDGLNAALDRALADSSVQV